MIQINKEIQREEAAQVGQDMPSEDLHEIMNAYNQLTQRLQNSHELLGEEVIRLRKQLASQEGQLARSRRLAAVGEMAAGIAHEIRNPLAALQLYTQMLAEDFSDLSLAGASGDKGKAFRGISIIQKMSGAIKGLNEIVGDVLTFSKEINPRIEKVNLDQLLLKVLSLYDPQIEAAGIEVQITGDQITLDADALLLQQALANLIRNSVDALKGGGGRITLSSIEKDGDVLLKIRDNGPGVDEAIVDRIFNPFFTTRASGTGLGLAIVHRIVEAHQGAISVYNDGGAVFELLLPLEQQQVAPLVVGDEKSLKVSMAA